MGLENQCINAGEGNLLKEFTASEVHFPDAREHCLESSDDSREQFLQSLWKLNQLFAEPHTQMTAHSG